MRSAYSPDDRNVHCYQLQAATCSL